MGAGLSGFQLYNALRKESALVDKKILLLDDNSSQEKTWCFWERGSGQWDDIVYNRWKKGFFKDGGGQLDLKMGGYEYKMIRSSDFINEFQKRLAKDPNAELIIEKVDEIDINKSLVITAKTEYQGKIIFDSRFDPKEVSNSKKPYVLQHFKGRFVKADQDIFDPSVFTMMDFGPSKSNQCTFIYVLPFSESEALIEYTFFTPELVPEKEYDRLIDSYLANEYKGVEFKEVDSEFGIIPMSTHDFQSKNTDNYCRIGTAGGWVKASSGYSFKHSEKNSKRIAKNIKGRKRADSGLTQARFRLYDLIFLSILKHENEIGNRIFQEMYRKNSAQQIFKFLDEDTNPFEELRIVTSFNPTPFLRALRRELM